MVRRLAKQRRDDAYGTRRDYQHIITQAASRLSPRIGQLGHLDLDAGVDVGPHGVAAFGGFARSRSASTLSATVTVGGVSHYLKSRLSPNWSRFGRPFRCGTVESCRIAIRLDPPLEWLDIWGWRVGAVVPPAGLAIPDDWDQRMSELHLAPETFYLDHSSSPGVCFLDPPFDTTSIPGAISTKKCSYCGRFLPIDPDRPSALSFHKHNAKKSGHQNECRACKKWRINNTFNPIRTADQFHESSTIYRERTLFLREPIILQSIKDRQGDGLKSIVWNQFGRKCFCCGVRIKLKDVQLDHTRPFAYLWPIDIYATCLCGTCNNHKGDRFPVDFYSSAKLVELAALVGLPLSDLMVRDVCQVELDRIVTDIARFAMTWDPRTFNAVARKIKEVRPNVDLFEVLLAADPGTYNTLKVGLARRPPSVDAMQVLPPDLLELNL